ncbi:tetratricopeptide repeat protein [Marinomonas ostreistagni]|uniref:Tetratricopeptide repeat protein n=1 Tax=Marinomonas ostreistagni TaxID=359209 RepID=A0ABS0ZCT5_9GAMM|nr:tetratricopeptide repeat protein [Marinomonas ostreistagni]MBJ7551490.1 tetratricopeptide repeat protein [Marinomonas ostreistagni]
MKYHLYLAVALYFSHISVSAADTHSECVLPTNVPTVPNASEWTDLRLQLEPELPNCLNDSGYFALYGASLLNTGSIDSALEMLERALLIDPLNGSAQIDYAQALFQNGQLLAALQINQSILDRQDLPESLAHFLQSRQDSWDQFRFQNRFQLTAIQGYSSNLNNATLTREHLVTLDDSDAILSLDDDDLATPGSYSNLGVSARFYELNDQSTDVIKFDLKSRISDLSEFDTDELSIGFEKEIEARTYRDTWEVSAEHVQLGDSALYSSLESDYERYWTAHSVMPYLKSEIRYADFHSNSRLDETSLGFITGLGFGPVDNRLGMEIEFNQNFALKDRYGGDKTTIEGQLYWDAALWNGRLVSRVGYSNADDHESYPLLDSDQKRKIYSKSASVQYFYPISSTFIIHAGYNYKDQNSNLSIFDIQTENVDLGLTYRF